METVVLEGRWPTSASKRPLRAFLPVYRQERALFFFLPSLAPFLSFLVLYIYILLFLPFVFNRTPKEREGKRKNREGQEREAVKRSVYIRVYVYIYFIAASLVRSSRRARPLARSELGLIKT